MPRVLCTVLLLRSPCARPQLDAGRWDPRGPEQGSTWPCRAVSEGQRREGLGAAFPVLRTGLPKAVWEGFRAASKFPRVGAAECRSRGRGPRAPVFR